MFSARSKQAEGLSFQEGKSKILHFLQEAANREPFKSTVHWKTRDEKPSTVLNTLSRLAAVYHTQQISNLLLLLLLKTEDEALGDKKKLPVTKETRQSETRRQPNSSATL